MKHRRRSVKICPVLFVWELTATLHLSARGTPVQLIQSSSLHETRIRRLTLPQRFTVLVLDDLASNRDVFRAVLSRLENLTVLDADTCAKALELNATFGGGPIDLLLADLTLPDGLGTSVAVRLREGNPELRIVLTSGTPFTQWPPQAERDVAQLQSTCWELLPKPFLPKKLIEVVNRMLTARTSAAPPAGPVKTILLAEDSDSLRYALARYLESRGFRVLTAGDGREAVRQWRDSYLDIDLVISDYRMPHVDGAGVADAVATERPAVPLLFISASDTEELLEKRPDVVLLRKPFELEVLLKRVSDLLNTPPKADAATA